MKLDPKTWCKIQETLANLNCPNCFSIKVNLKDTEGENAKCEECGCTFEFSPDLEYRSLEP